MTAIGSGPPPPQMFLAISEVYGYLWERYGSIGRPANIFPDWLYLISAYVIPVAETSPADRSRRRRIVYAVAKSDGSDTPSTTCEGRIMAKKYIYKYTEGDGKNKMLLGGKGANLCEMTQIGLRVPPGFVISTEACLTTSTPTIACPMGSWRLARTHGLAGAGNRQTVSVAPAIPSWFRCARFRHVHAGHDGHHSQSRLNERRSPA